MSADMLLALPVMLPLMGAAMALLLRHHARLQMWVSILTLVAILASALVMARSVLEVGILVLQIGRWTPQLGIVLVADRLTVIMLVVSSVVTLAVLVYSSAQTVSESAEKTPATSTR